MEKLEEKTEVHDGEQPAQMRGTCVLCKKEGDGSPCFYDGPKSRGVGIVCDECTAKMSLKPKSDPWTEDRRAAFGKAVKEARVRKDLSLREAAAAAWTIPSTMCDIERGMRSPTRNVFDRLVKALGLEGWTW